MSCCVLSLSFWRSLAFSDREPAEGGKPLGYKEGMRGLGLMQGGEGGVHQVVRVDLRV